MWNFRKILLGKREGIRELYQFCPCYHFLFSESLRTEQGDFSFDSLVYKGNVQEGIGGTYFCFPNLLTCYIRKEETRQSGHRQWAVSQLWAKLFPCLSENVCKSHLFLWFFPYVNFPGYPEIRSIIKSLLFLCCSEKERGEAALSSRAEISFRFLPKFSDQNRCLPWNKYVTSCL